MWYFREHPKRIMFCLGVILIGILLIIFLLIRNLHNLTEQTPYVRIEFVENIRDPDWITELYNFVEEKLDNPINKNSRNNFTDVVAHCRATCNSATTVNEINFDDQCKTLPIWIYDWQVTSNILSHMTYAEATTPCFLKIATSRIPNSGKGIFTTKSKISEGFLFGPYHGIIREDSPDYVVEEKFDMTYAWIIHPKNGKKSFHIDGIDENNSNWLRYVNMARYEEEQNMFPLLFNDTVYYYVYKDIEPDTELLVWYGANYAQYLGVDVISTSKHDWDFYYAPPLSETICPTCPVTDGEKRIDINESEDLSEDKNHHATHSDDNDDEAVTVSWDQNESIDESKPIQSQHGVERPGESKSVSESEYVYETRTEL